MSLAFFIVCGSLLATADENCVVGEGGPDVGEALSNVEDELIGAPLEILRFDRVAHVEIRDVVVVA